MQEPPDPGQVAFEDQIRAAGAHAAEWLAQQGRRQAATVTAAQTPQWQRDALAAMGEASRRDALKSCRHLTRAPQPVAVLAEAPWVLHCLDCYTLREADRRCSDCNRPAGRLSLEGGGEDVIHGPAVIWSRLRCARCVRSTTDPGGTFGNG